MTSSKVLKRGIREKTKENCIEQLGYANSLIIEIVDHIPSLPNPKPIVVIQADEGPWPREWVKDEIARLGGDTSDVEWTKATPSQLKQKMAILNAVFLPDLSGTAAVHIGTPINTIRTIFREYFGG